MRAVRHVRRARVAEGVVGERRRLARERVGLRRHPAAGAVGVRVVVHEAEAVDDVGCGELVVADLGVDHHAGELEAGLGDDGRRGGRGGRIAGQVGVAVGVEVGVGVSRRRSPPSR